VDNRISPNKSTRRSIPRNASKSLNKEKETTRTTDKKTNEITGNTTRIRRMGTGKKEQLPMEIVFGTKSLRRGRCEREKVGRSFPL